MRGVSRCDCKRRLVRCDLHRAQEHLLHHLELEAIHTGDAAGTVRQDAHLAHAEILQHLRAEADVAPVG